MTCGDIHPNPGPRRYLTIATANVTALNAHPEIHTMCAWGENVDVIALQECRVAEGDRYAMECDARARQRKMVWGKMQDATNTKAGNRTNYGGVGFSVAADLPARAIAPSR